MALGGGSFTVQNKELPGAYINFVSAASANAGLSDRGIVTMPLELDWGIEGEIFEVTSGDFRKNSQKILGYPYDHEKMKGLRDLFLNARTLYAYRLNSGGEKAQNLYAAARYAGIRGNDLKIVIQTNADDSSLFDVKTLLGTAEVDSQTVSGSAELIDNDYVLFEKTAELAVTASSPLSGGENGSVDGTAYQAYADKIEGYTYHVMGIAATDETTKKLFVSFNRRLRDELGIKFQLVLYGYPKADYMGVISVKNKVKEDAEASLVYWVAGKEASCEVNRSCQNSVYDGEFSVDTAYTQNELKAAVKAGEFVFHNVNGSVRVLEDINTMVTTTDTQGDIFKDNQTVRVVDQLGNDIAMLFNTKYLGVVPNDAAGRISLWSDIVAYHRELERIRAIEDFSEDDITVEQGEHKKSVVVSDSITIVNAMDKLYMTVTVS